MTNHNKDKSKHEVEGLKINVSHYEYIQFAMKGDIETNLQHFRKTQTKATLANDDYKRFEGKFFIAGN